jgi:hypothetical protein
MKEEIEGKRAGKKNKKDGTSKMRPVLQEDAPAPRSRGGLGKRAGQARVFKS